MIKSLGFGLPSAVPNPSTSEVETSSPISAEQTNQSGTAVSSSQQQNANAASSRFASDLKLENGLASQALASKLFSQIPKLDPPDPKGIQPPTSKAAELKDPLIERGEQKFAFNQALIDIGKKQQEKWEDAMTLVHIRGEFSDLAKDPERFHSEVRSMFGENYNVAAAENLRLKLVNDYFGTDWLPNLVFERNTAVFQGHQAAVGMNGNVYIRNDMKNDSALVHKAIWASMRSQLDPQDAVNPEGRNFGTISVNGGSTLVEWIN